MRQRYREMVGLETPQAVVLSTLFSTALMFLGTELGDALAGGSLDIGLHLIAAGISGSVIGALNYRRYRSPQDPGRRPESRVAGAALLVGGIAILVAVLIVSLVAR